MSILLEALRKSERRERRGEVPTIHQDEVGPQGAARTTGRVVMAALLILTAIVLGVLFWRQYQPQEPPAPAEMAQPGPVPAGASTTMETANEAATAAIRQGARTPMEVLPDTPPEAPEAQAQDQADEAEVVGAPPGAASALRDARIEEMTQAARQAGLVPPSAPPPDQAGAGQATEPPAKTATGEPQAASPADRNLEPISYWQVPESIRKELPPLKITVLVYSEQPAERFVLLDSRRRVEGDTVAPGLDLVEVRREGVVMTYRAYRFLVRH